MEIERRSLGIIDCYIEAPEINAFNFLSEFLDPLYRVSYHVASQGIEQSLINFPNQGYIVLGSYSHVSEKLAWHQWLADFLLDKIGEGIPVLGICFAHQLFVDQMGGKINWVDDDQEVKNGSRVLKIKDKFQKYFKQSSYQLFYTHSQMVTKLPSDFESMVTSRMHPYDLICHKNLPLVTLQPHPEYFIDKRFKELNLPLTIMDDGKDLILSVLNFLFNKIEN